MRHIEKEAGVAGIVLRPLSAKILEPTAAETGGYIKREDLFAISGRGRNPQLKLVNEFGIKNYPRPGNDCCFLIDQSYAVRFFDLMKHRQLKSVSMEDVIRLRLGRHFRIKETHKIIIGRNEAENGLLEKYVGDGMALIKAVAEIGPVGLMEGVFDESDTALAASIIAGYGKGKLLTSVEFNVRADGAEKIISVKPADPQLYSQFIIQHHSGHGPK
jgi:hypothetical protein